MSKGKQFNTLINFMHNKDVLVVSCGPSMNRWKNIYNDFPDDQKPILICIKQSVNSVDVPCDLHVFNHCNLRRYKYHIKPRATVFGTSSSDKNKFWFISADYKYSVTNGGHYSESLAIHNDVDSFLKLSTLTGHQLWGPGIMHEFIFPLLLSARVKSITTVGWDIASADGVNVHYYDDSTKDSYVDVIEQHQGHKFINRVDVIAPRLSCYLRKFKDFILQFKMISDYFLYKNINIVGMWQGEASILSGNFKTLKEACSKRGIALHVISDSVWFK